MNSKKDDTALPKPIAELADPHALYEKSVQSPDHDTEFLGDYYEEYRGQPLRHFREDFCGTAFLSSFFVTLHPDNHAVGIDLDWPTLNWGIKHNVASLTPAQQQRLNLIQGNVLDLHNTQSQLIAAMNFSYMVFRDRPTLLQYFTQVRQGLQAGGLFMFDIWGGSESQVEQEELRDIENPDTDGIGNFTFSWDQDKFDPATYFCTTRIHFNFQDGSEMRNAFVYNWRMWTIPEVTELMQEAGFQDVHFLWEGTDPETHEGTGIYERSTIGDADIAWIAYMVGVNPE